MAWESNSQDGSGWGIYGQRFDESGVKLGNEFRINTYTTNAQRNPRIAALSGGSVTVVWQSEGQDGSSSGIIGQVFNGAGVKTGSEYRINTYTMGDQMVPALTALSLGVASDKMGLVMGSLDVFFPVIRFLQ